MSRADRQPFKGHAQLSWSLTGNHRARPRLGPWASQLLIGARPCPPGCSIVGPAAPRTTLLTHIHPSLPTEPAAPAMLNPHRARRVAPRAPLHHLSKCDFVHCCFSDAGPVRGASASLAGVRETLYGVIFVKCPLGAFPFFSYLSFFVRLGSPFLCPDPHERYAGARRSGQGWRVSATARPVLDGSEHDGTVGVVGTTTSRGARVWCTKDRATSLYSAGA
jgi:hypothetical protein